MTQLQKLQSANDISLYIREVNRYPVLSADEERSLAIRYADEGDLDAARQLVTSNLRFVVKTAFDYINYGFPLHDLIQEGNLGLMMAVKKFDPRKNIRLITYAVWWIKAYIQQYIMDNYSLVKVGTTQNQRKLFYNLPKLKRELLAQSRTPGEVREEIARELDVSPDEVAEMEQRLSARDSSLDLPAARDADTALVDTISDYRPDAVEIIEDAEELAFNSGRVGEAMRLLSDKERFIIQKRILNEEPLTLQEVAETLGISRERVRQIEQRAIEKLRAAVRPDVIDVR